MDEALQHSDYEWFLDNYDDLFKTYGDSYLAIKNKQVIGKYKSFAEGVRETQKSEPLGSFIVQFCNGNKTGFTNRITSIFVVGA